MINAVIVGYGIVSIIGPYVLSYIFKIQYGVYIWPYVLPF